MLTLEKILEEENKRRTEGGDLGITACKRSINFARDHLNESYFVQLEKYVDRANTDPFFNNAMVLACWELINGR